MAAPLVHAKLLRPSSGRSFVFLYCRRNHEKQ
nr:MAG TPA: hypothetical protein [Caudoviricetes sp.]